MCGIAGIVYTGEPNGAAQAVRRMIALQSHRGPDGEGYYEGDGIVLGHLRLAIIDTSDAGSQPMADSEGRFWIVYNGEIYNYVELGRELEGLGHRFRGHSDTEVLLAAYRQWGEGCLRRLRGMFAFAIWDERERRLFAARDRLGIKPLHYWARGRERFAFSSELKALLDFLPERRADRRLAADFLAWSLLEHEAGDTMIEGIKRLPAAHYLTWRSGEGLALRRYWDLQVTEELETPPERRDRLVREFRERFIETVSLHLRSDVPVGTSLSGGLDSSAIMCVANAELKRRGVWQHGWQHAFSACFDEPALDERPYIREVARATGCETHCVFPTAERLLEELDEWLWHQEEPVASTSVYAQYCVGRLAKEHGIKVLLDGQGADEQLAGYRKFILVYLRQLASRGRYAKAAREAAAFAHPDILRTSRLAHGRRYLLRAPDELAQLWPNGSLPSRPAGMGIGKSLGGRIEADLARFSLPVLLRYEDRNTMAFGVESRVPFVDHLLLEWLATLPADMRLSGGWTKRIMREALVGILPERIRTRKSKIGFETPQSRWLAGPLSSWLSDTLAAPRYIGEVVETEGVASLLDRYRAGRASPALQNTLFRLAVYEAWARKFLGASTAKGPELARQRPGTKEHLAATAGL